MMGRANSCGLFRASKSAFEAASELAHRAAIGSASNLKVNGRPAYAFKVFCMLRRALIDPSSAPSLLTLQQSLRSPKWSKNDPDELVHLQS